MARLFIGGNFRGADWVDAAGPTPRDWPPIRP
jgi:hypothetical protein